MEDKKRRSDEEPVDKKKETSRKLMKTVEGLNDDDGPKEPKEKILYARNHDIVFGRGRPYQNHPGNVRLKKIVGFYKKWYQQARKADTAGFADKIVALMKSDTDENGNRRRFLRRSEDYWYEVDDHEAKNKVYRMFWDRSRNTEEETKVPSSLGMAVAPDLRAAGPLVSGYGFPPGYLSSHLLPAAPMATLLPPTGIYGQRLSRIAAWEGEMMSRIATLEEEMLSMITEDEAGYFRQARCGPPLPTSGALASSMAHQTRLLGNPLMLMQPYYSTPNPPAGRVSDFVRAQKKLP